MRLGLFVFLSIVVGIIVYLWFKFLEIYEG